MSTTIYIYSSYADILPAEFSSIFDEEWFLIILQETKFLKTKINNPNRTVAIPFFMNSSTVVGVGIFFLKWNSH